MENKVHALAKNGTFLFRFNDGEFGSKWCGVWKKNTKYFDYFAFSLNGVFLSSANFMRFDFYNSQFAKLYFQTKDGTVAEEITCIDDAIIVVIRPEFAADVYAEIGVNIRDRSENYIKSKRYEVSEWPKKFTASNGGKVACVSFDKGSFKKEEYYGIHAPGIYAKGLGFSKYFDDCSSQNKYVPGHVDAKLSANEELTFIFSMKDLDNESVFKILKNRQNYPKEYGDIINRIYSNFGENSTMDGDLIKDSIDALYSYANFMDQEMYAGYPYFNQFWIRDALFVLPSFLSLNNPNYVKTVLVKIAGMINERGLTNFAGNDASPLDTPAEFIICLYEYFKWTGDSATLKALASKLQMLLAIGRDSFEKGLIRDSGLRTWMDSIPREYSIEIQALWAAAFKRAAELMPIIDEESSDLIELSSEISKNLTRYRREGYFSDQLNKDTNSANQLFLPFFRISNDDDSKTIMKNAEENLLSDKGVYSVAKTDGSYNPEGYHNGAIWPFLTNILLASAVRDGYDGITSKCIQSLRNVLGLQCSSRINEIIAPNGKPEGCPSQSWSICMLPHIIDRFALGISVNAPENEIKVAAPAPNVTAKRSIFVNMKEIKLEIANGVLTSNKEVIDEGDYFRVVI